MCVQSHRSLVRSPCSRIRSLRVFGTQGDFEALSAADTGLSVPQYILCRVLH